MTSGMKAVLLGFLLMNIACSSRPRYPVSDHFDGRRFFNPPPFEEQTFWGVMKFLFSRNAEKWPKKVENHPAPRLDLKLEKNQVAVTFVNHATTLLQINGHNILTDPVWSRRVSPLSFAGPKRVREPGISLEQLPKIDVVVVSHNHYDHLDTATLKWLIDKFQPLIVVPLGNEEQIKGLGAERVVELDWWQSTKYDETLEIMLTPTQHFSGRGLLDRFKTLWGSYMLKTEGVQIYFGGDAGYSAHYREIQQRLGAPDLALIPIGAYEPRWFMKPVHLNPEESVQAHLDLGARKSIGIHFGTFQLTDEKIDQPVIDLEKSKKDKGLKDDEFVVLPEGRTETYFLGLTKR